MINPLACFARYLVSNREGTCFRQRLPGEVFEVLKNLILAHAFEDFSPARGAVVSVGARSNGQVLSSVKIIKELGHLLLGFRRVGGAGVFPGVSGGLEEGEPGEGV